MTNESRNQMNAFLATVRGILIHATGIALGILAADYLCNYFFHHHL
jgi:hypothetical protein